MTTMRAKLVVTSVQTFGGRNAEGENVKSSEKVSFTGVSRANGYTETNGLDEDNTYAKYSPQADFTITIANPALFDKFFPGQKFYADFTPAA